MFEVDGVMYSAVLVFTLDGEELSIGVLDGSSSNAVPLSPEALLGAERVNQSEVSVEVDGSARFVTLSLELDGDDLRVEVVGGSASDAVLPLP